MAREFNRTERVADFLKRELATLIQRELRDPRLGMVSVTDAEVSRDLAHARVYVTVLGKDTAADAKPSIDVLNQASGFLRSHLAKMSTARTTPKLKFVFDDSVGRGQALSSLIDNAVAADRRRSGDGE